MKKTTILLIGILISFYANAFSFGGQDFSDLLSNDTNKKVKNEDLDLTISSDPFVSGKLDKLCEDPVAEWDSTKGTVELATIAASFYIENMFSGGTSTADRQLAMKQKAIHINWMPMAVEKGIGQYIHTSHYKDKVLSAENAQGMGKKNIKKANAIWGEVTKIIDKEYPAHPYKWNFNLTKEGRGAFASSGGYIYLSTEVLKKDKEIIKAILLHEASHVLKRHKTKRYQAIIIDAMSSIDMIKDLAQGGGSQNSINQVMNTIGIMKHVDKLIGGFDDNQEFEADGCAVMAASKSGINKNVFDDYEAFIKDMTSNKSDTHGNPKIRIQEIHNAVRHYY